MLTDLPIEGKFFSLAILIAALWALLLCIRAFNLLARRETPLLQELKKNPPATLEEAREKLNHYSGSDTAQMLQSALETGTVDPGLLAFYDRIYWSRALAGLFVFIGLLGTVWGISVAISNLGVTV